MSEYNVEMLIAHVNNCEEQCAILVAELVDLSNTPFSYKKVKRRKLKRK